MSMSYQPPGIRKKLVLLVAVLLRDLNWSLKNVLFRVHKYSAYALVFF